MLIERGVRIGVRSEEVEEEGRTVVQVKREQENPYVKEIYGVQGLADEVGSESESGRAWNWAFVVGHLGGGYGVRGHHFALVGIGIVILAIVCFPAVAALALIAGLFTGMRQG